MPAAKLRLSALRGLSIRLCLLALCGSIVLVIPQSSLVRAQINTNGTSPAAQQDCGKSLDLPTAVVACTPDELKIATEATSGKQHIILSDHMDLTSLPKLNGTATEVQRGTDAVLAPNDQILSIRVRLTLALSPLNQNVRIMMGLAKLLFLAGFRHMTLQILPCD
jgi:hypothetical protein